MPRDAISRRVIDEGWIEREETERARLAAEGMYRPETEHTSCGGVLIAAAEAAAEKDT